jgi:anti-anti-sigma factor
MTANGGSGPRNGPAIRAKSEEEEENRGSAVVRCNTDSAPGSLAGGARAFCGYLDESLVLALKGQLRYMTARALRAFLDSLLEQDGTETVIIDLRELESIDSTGMGLLARIGRTTLTHGRRSVIVCPAHDVMTCLRSAAFDTLFIMSEYWPFEREPHLSEVPLEGKELLPDVTGRVMLEAHRDLVAMSEENRLAFSGVVAALEADLNRRIN